MAKKDTKKPTMIEKVGELPANRHFILATGRNLPPHVSEIRTGRRATKSRLKRGAKYVLRQEDLHVRGYRKAEVIGGREGRPPLSTGIELQILSADLLQ